MFSFTEFEMMLHLQKKIIFNLLLKYFEQRSKDLIEASAVNREWNKTVWFLGNRRM